MTTCLLHLLSPIFLQPDSAFSPCLGSYVTSILELESTLTCITSLNYILVRSYSTQVLLVGNKSKIVGLHSNIRHKCANCEVDTATNKLLPKLHISTKDLQGNPKPQASTGPGLRHVFKNIFGLGLGRG